MKEKDNLEKAREIMGKIDPELLPSAIRELMIEVDEAEEPDVEETKKALKKVYDSIPEGKDKASIMSKAIYELDNEIVTKEIEEVKGKLAGFGKETLVQGAKEYIDISVLMNCPDSQIWKCPPVCKLCVNSLPKPNCLSYCINRCVGRSVGLWKPVQFEGEIVRKAHILSDLISRVGVVDPDADPHSPAINEIIQRSHDLSVSILTGVVDPDGDPISPAMEILKAEIKQEMLQSRELKRNMRKMITDIQNEKS